MPVASPAFRRMSTARLDLSLERLARALDRLDEVLALPGQGPILDATIQRFEFTVELLWKTLKRALEDSGRTAPATPREVFAAAWQTGWLEDDEPLWCGIVADRNRTAHAYDDATAREIYLRIRDYAPAMRRAFEGLRLCFGDPPPPGDIPSRAPGGSSKVREPRAKWSRRLASPESSGAAASPTPRRRARANIPAPKAPHPRVPRPASPRPRPKVPR